MTTSSVATLPRRAETSARLRTLLWSTVATWGCSRDRVDDAALVLSELVGNAVRHAEGERIHVRLRREGEVLRIAVRDGSVRLPGPRRAADDEESGRGMMIIEALSLRWGCEPTGDGKVVWAEVPL